MNCDFEILAGIITVMAVSTTIIVLWCDYQICRIMNRQWEYIKNLRRVINMHEEGIRPKGRWAYEKFK